MLAIVARSGQFLPICLTFGPVNGPEDFSYVVDRNFAPGRNAKHRFCKEWHAYIDDLTVRTGRVLDGVFYTDDQVTDNIRAAARDPRALQAGQSPEEALEALGFDTRPLSKEKKLVASAKRAPAKKRHPPQPPAPNKCHVQIGSAGQS